MSELQAALEFQVELSKFYNVDLFQRGYYQLRTSLKSNPKSPVKVEVRLPQNNECDLIFPASVINGVAVSKTFQILYRNEDVSIDDVILFKVQMLVDSQKIEESIEQAEFSLAVDLWFTEEEVGPEYQDKLTCISQRVLRLHFDPNQGLHHHLPILFDYFHLSVVCATIHATLTSLHQPYISFPGRPPKAAWQNDTNSLESIYFGSPNRTASFGTTSVDRKLRESTHVHKTICQVLLSAYESLQNSFTTLTDRLPPYCKKIKIEAVDCHKKLELILQVLQSFEDEEDFLQTAQSDVAQLCAENVILWAQYLDMVTLNDKITHQLAKEHHLQRVKRFAEGFFTYEYSKSAAISCFEPSVNGHTDIATVVRNSAYFQNIPPLAVECTDMDGDTYSTPLIFEDVYCEVWQAARQFTTTTSALDSSGENSSNNSGTGVTMRPHRDSRSSNNSSNLSGEDSTSSPKFKRASKFKLIKNIKLETIKRPSAQALPSKNVAGMGPVNATLVGYKKIDHDTSTPIVELGTLSPCQPLASQRFTIAASMPSLAGPNSTFMSLSGSMPDLCRSLSLKDNSSKHTSAKPDLFLSSTAEVTKNTNEAESASPPLTLPSDVISSVNSSSNKSSSAAITNTNSAATTQQPPLSLSSSSDSSLNGDAVQNGYLPNNTDVDGENVNSNCKSLVDYTSLSSALTEALGDGGAMGAEDSGQVSMLSSITNVSETGRGANSKMEKQETADSGIMSMLDGTTTTFDSNNTDILSSTQIEVSLVANDTTTTSFKQVTSVTPDVVRKKTSVSNEASPNKGMSDSQSESYLSGECTLLELLEEEYERCENKKKVAAAAHAKISSTPKKGKDKFDAASSKGTRLGIGAKKMMGSKEVAKRGEFVHLSSSSPDLYELRAKFLVSPVHDKTINFIAAKENLRKLLRYQGHIYSDYPTQASTVPYFWPPESARSHQETTDRADEGIHLVVCVHGLDGNSADLRLVRTYLELALPGAKIDFLMSERNQPDTFADFEEMTDRLVEEILYHVDIYGINPSRISFVGHSLGNLIIRSALSRSSIAHLLPRLYTFLSLSGPHLGTLYNSSGLVNAGMWFMQKWKKSGSLLQLSLKDHTDPRQTFLYKLSQRSGMEFFKNILLVSSQQDRYVPYHSSRIELCKPALKDSTGLGGVYAEMVANILQPIIMKQDIRIIRYDVFHALQNNANNLIGRAAHIAVLDSEIFIEKFMTVAGLKYFK